VGEFRFKDQRYPADFGQAQKFPVGSRSGAILDITVNCVPDGAKNKLANYSYGNLKIGGEKAFEEFLGLIGFGQTKYMAFLHNNLQYTASEYVYVSPADKASEQKIRDNYTAVFNKIVSSFSFNGN
jgi:hypothetical protein